MGIDMEKVIDMGSGGMGMVRGMDMGICMDMEIDKDIGNMYI
jgi:hypothetical protein